MAYNDDEKPEVKVIDLDHIPDLGEEDEYDYEASAFGFGPLPKPGTFLFKVSLNENQGVQQKQTKDKKDYFSIPLVFETDSDKPEESGYIYQTVSTNISAKKKTSTCITILKAAGVELPQGSISQKKQLELLAKWLNSDPKFWLETDWEVSYKDEKDQYQRMFRSYKSIPNDPAKEGEKLTTFTKKLKNGDVVEASPRLIVKQYLGKSKDGIGTTTVAKAPVASLPPKNGKRKSVEELEKELENA